MPHRDRADIYVWQNVGFLLSGLQVALNVCGSIATSEVGPASLLTAGVVAAASVVVYIAQRGSTSHASLLSWPILGMVAEVAFAIVAPQAATLSLGYFTLMFLFLAMTQPRQWPWIFLAPSLGCLVLVIDLPAPQLLVRMATSVLVWMTVAELTGYLLRMLDARRLQILEHAGLDALTGVRNRRDLADSLDVLDSESALLLIDIDDFKQVNDTDGHQAGDRLLSDLASFLSRSLRETDSVFRYGGDEFLVILPDTDLGEAEQLAQRVVKAWEQTSPAANFSCGVAVGGPGALSRADLALYVHKERPASGTS